MTDKHSGSTIKPVHQQNYVSAYQRRAQVEKELLNEIKIGQSHGRQKTSNG